MVVTGRKMVCKVPSVSRGDCDEILPSPLVICRIYPESWPPAQRSTRRAACEGRAWGSDRELGGPCPVI